MSNQEESNLYEVFQSLPPELQKEFFRQLELSQNELLEKLLDELDQIKLELQELKKLNSRPPDRKDGDELINKTADTLIKENKKFWNIEGKK